MNCRRFHESFSDFADGLLDEVVEIEVRRHLAECACCRRFDAAFLAGRGALQALPPVSPSRGFGRRLRERLRHECGEGSPALGPWSGAAAALLVLALVSLAALEVRSHEEDLAAGADSLIVADLPVDACPELRRIQLVAPTSTDERLRLAADRTDGWLYLVSVTGTTGARDSLSAEAESLVRRARRVTRAPLYLGFGISTPAQATAAGRIADGVVVGSRAVEVAEEGPEALLEYVSSLREALDATAAARL